MRRGTGERRLPTCVAPALEVDFKGPGRGPGTCLPTPRKALEMERTSVEHNGFVYASLLAARPKAFFMSRRRPRRVRVIAIADQCHVVRVGAVGDDLAPLIPGTLRPKTSVLFCNASLHNSIKKKQCSKMRSKMAPTLLLLNCKNILFWQCKTCTDNAHIRSIAKIRMFIFYNGKGISLDV